jgi:colicin import membrane protein
MIRPAPYQHFSAGGMSLLVHGLFIAFLLFGVSWRSLPQVPVEAELWSSLPEPLAPLPLPEPVIEAPPQVEMPPPVEKPVVEKPVVEKPAVEKADIALEQAEKKRQEAESLRLKEEARKLAEQERLAKEAGAQAEKLRQEQLRQEQLRRERERERKLMEQELARQAQEELDAEAVQLRGSLRAPPVDSGRQARLVGESQERIRSKILGYLRLPPNLSGNPEVVFKVALLPNGEVVSAQLLRSSGQPAYDREMERAILKASPLPLPGDREAAASFRDGLILKFRPREDAQAGR